MEKNFGDDIREVYENFAKMNKEIGTEVEIKDESITDLSDEATAKIEASAFSDVDFEIERQKFTLRVNKVELVVDDIRMKHRGSSSQSSFRYPLHWSYYKSGKQPAGKRDHRRTELPHHGNVFGEVSRLVMETWEQQKVGLGNDATGLGPHTIKIRKIYCIENPLRYRAYMSKKEEFYLEASVDRCPRVNGLQRQREIMTLRSGLKNLDALLASEVNECYLLHGTKRDMVDLIESTGLDSRLCRGNVLFGPGTYFTESSTKADQYADDKNERVRNGKRLYMFVCRVLLGHTYICQNPKFFVKPPCMQAGCYSDRCPSNHPYFDSVIGTHKNPTTRLLFREFVIYHPDQSYPEFLVEYERQKSYP